MTSALSVSRLHYAYDDHTILDRLSFEVGPGRFFIVIGPNGSGKTTLLKLLVGLLAPQAGAIEVLGQPIDAYSPRRLARHVAYVPQSVATEFPFKVREVVLMGRAPHLGVLGFESPSDLEIANEAMAYTDVTHLAHRRLDQCSGGEQQRVFIARAICQQPDIILLDEPTAALDMAHQIRVMDLMERLKAGHRMTVVMVSHDLNMAAMYADDVLLLNKGAIASLGAPREVLDFSLLEAVYGCTLLVDQSPLGDYPRIHQVPGRYITKPS